MLITLAAAGRNPTDILIPTQAGTEGSGGGDDEDDDVAGGGSASGEMTFSALAGGGGEAGSQLVPPTYNQDGGPKSVGWEASKAAVCSLGTGLLKIGKGFGKAAYDVVAVPYDLVAGTEHSYYGSATAQMLRQGKPVLEIQEQVAENIVLLGTPGFMDALEEYDRTGDPTNLQEYSGGLVFAAVAAKASQRLAGARTAPETVPAPKSPLEIVAEGYGQAAERGPVEVPPAAERTPLPSAPTSSPLTQGQQSAIKKIGNTISGHLKPGPKGDISGTVSDMVGNPIPKPGGGYFDHVQEMQNTLRGLRKHAATLEGVSDPAAQAARQMALDAIAEIEAAIKGAGL